MLTLSPPEIEGYVKQLEKESSAIKEELLKVTWYMRGGLDYEQALNLSYEERKLCQKIIKENIEFVKKTQLPIL